MLAFPFLCPIMPVNLIWGPNSAYSLGTLPFIKVIGAFLLVAGSIFSNMGYLMSPGFPIRPFFLNLHLNTSFTLFLLCFSPTTMTSFSSLGPSVFSNHSPTPSPESSHNVSSSIPKHNYHIWGKYLIALLLSLSLIASQLSCLLILLHPHLVPPIHLNLMRQIHSPL